MKCLACGIDNRAGRRFCLACGASLPAPCAINTRPVVVARIGDDLRMDYTAVGDTTDLAARLEALAEPGTVLVSEVTHRGRSSRARAAATPASSRSRDGTTSRRRTS
jgi:class 3 adenylate cyclase